MPWEMEDCGWVFGGRTRRKELLAEGWEPFAVTEGAIWFRRFVEPGPVWPPRDDCPTVLIT